MRKPLSAEDLLYRLGLWLLPVFFLSGIVTACFGDAVLGWFSPCPIHAVTGLYCPGCGATRSVLELARLHIVESFCYHPFFPYTAVVYAVFLLWETIRRRVLPQLPQFPVFACIVAGIVLLFLQCIWKNAALFLGWNPFFLF